jgi:predicted ATPase
VIKKLYLENFKCIQKEELIFRNLTILTGENSSGKSSVIQAILLAGNHPNLISTPFNGDLRNYLLSLGDVNSLLNKYQNAKEYHIKVELDNFEPLELNVNKKSNDTCNFYIKDFKYPNPLIYPDNLTYLNADRDRIRPINPLVKDLSVRYFQVDGRLITSYFFLHRDDSVKEYLIQDTSSYTLETQVNYWLKEITSISTIDFKTQEITPNQVKGFYDIDGLEFSPENVGAGVSYLISILVACLSAKKGNIIIIENPEIHLHPKSQARLGKFFAFIASKGIQIIIETHNDHIINKIRHEVFKEQFSCSDVIIYYKGIKNETFEKIEITYDGFFRRENGEFGFPEGFYDATLREIYEINRGKNK